MALLLVRGADGEWPEWAIQEVAALSAWGTSPDLLVDLLDALEKRAAAEVADE